MLGKADRGEGCLRKGWRSWRRNTGRVTCARRMTRALAWRGACAATLRPWCRSTSTGLCRSRALSQFRVSVPVALSACTSLVRSLFSTSLPPCPLFLACRPSSSDSLPASTTSYAGLTANAKLRKGTLLLLPEEESQEGSQDEIEGEGEGEGERLQVSSAGEQDQRAGGSSPQHLAAAGGEGAKVGA